MLNMEHHIYITLLVKQLGEPLTTEETTSLNNWLNESEEHRRMADEYRLTWERIPVGLNPRIQPDLDQAFDRLMGKIKTAETATPALQPVLKPTWLRPLTRAAAAALLLSVSIWGYQEYMAGPQMLMASAENLDKKSITLSDGTVVWLRKGGSIKYPEQFEGAERQIELVGEAFFDVAPNPQKSFNILTEANENIKVVGTSFSIKPTEIGTLVTVKSGTVLFEPSKGTQGASLTAGKQGLHPKNSSDIIVSNAVSMNELAWQRGGLEFVNTPLKQVVKDLEDYYKVQITLENSKLMDCPYTAPLVQLPIDKVLENLCTVYQIRLFNPNPGEYILRGGSCL